LFCFFLEYEIGFVMSQVIYRLSDVRSVSPESIFRKK
jgi:hypothetical protein